MSSGRWLTACIGALLWCLAAVSGAAQGFDVSVLDAGNPPLPLIVEETDLIQELKQQIFVARGYPVGQQVLVHDGSRLADTSTVADNNITTNDVLYLTLDMGNPLTISSINAASGTLNVSSTQMTAGITQIIEQSPSLMPSPRVWWNAAEGLATSSGTNWNLAMPAETEASFYRIRERNPRPPVTDYPGYELVWHDEFEGPVINPANWWHQLGDGTLYGLPPGWGNAELQMYTNLPENASIVGDEEGNSVLLIQALPGENPGDYTSARLVTDGLQAFRYGRIEARIRLPYSKGAFPAFWMLGSNQPVVNWPGCGEVDIVEMLGNKEDTVHGTAIYVNEDHLMASTSGSEVMTTGLFSDDYHIYGIDWTPTNITWHVDGAAYHSTPLHADMKEFQRAFYLLINLAVGGSWPGYPDATSVFPMRMFVDYVRVYRDVSLVDPGEPPLDIDEETLGAYLYDAGEAIQEGFTPFENVSTIVWGPAAPELSLSSNAVDGVWSAKAVYPGTSWGGMYFQLDSPANMSEYTNGNLVVALKVPEHLTAFEVKLESPGGQSGSVNLFNYTPVPINADFDEYTIPLADFTAQNFDLSSVSIPFALWNPNGAAEVLIDNLRFTP